VIAVFLTVLIGGAIADLQRAVRTGAADTLTGADLWIKPGGPNNVYSTQPFAYAETQHRLQRLGLVRWTVPRWASFLDLHRRFWVVGLPPRLPTLIARSQLAHGDLALSEQRLREGGWAVISQQIASERHLQLGDRFTVPTPSGAAGFRLAATVFNYGWPSGTVLMNGNDYRRLWRTVRAGELAVALKPGVQLERG
jgi:hypothetical protein